MRDEVLDALHRRGLLKDRAGPEVTPLTGGFWNDNFRVRGEGFDWVVKRTRAGDGASLFPVLPDAEANALRALRGLGIAPDLVDFFRTGEGDPTLVYAFWPGTPWREDVAPVADLLRRLHAIPADDPQGFRVLPTNPGAILAQGDDLLGRAGDDGLSVRLRSLRPAPDDGPDLELRSLVHTDVGAGNLISGPEGIRLIDWQCPGIGDPAEDVWAFLSPGFHVLFDHTPLTPHEREAFVKAYDGDRTLERLRFLAPCFAYRLTAYCCLRRRALADRDPALSERYGRAATVQIEEMEGVRA